MTTATLRRNEQGELIAAGDWTLGSASELVRLVAELHPRASDHAHIDASSIGRLDTAGAELLLELAGDSEVSGLDAKRRALLDAVDQARRKSHTNQPTRANSLIAMLARAGAAMERAAREAYQLLGFIGLTLTTLVRCVVNPRRWRVTAFAHHLEQTSLNAMPIVVLLNFLVGAVIAFLGATVLKNFGATIYTIELMGYSFLREFGVLLTAILLAGRSGSAFTAQLGSMKAREEVDAIRTLGLDPIEVLVLPRLLAMLLAMPILTVLAMLAGIIGGCVVCSFSLDISPTLFTTRLHELGATKHFWVGMSKAPLFGFLIAAIGCLEGFKVSGSAESVGTHTTSSVVQAIFVVILVDALAAVFFTEINI